MTPTPSTTSETTPTSAHARSKPRVRYLGGTRYLIESRSCPGLGRQVDTLVLKCSCPAGKWGKRCHHLVTALAFEAWRRQQQQKARAEAKALRAAAQAAEEVAA